MTEAETMTTSGEWAEKLSGYVPAEKLDVDAAPTSSRSDAPHRPGPAIATAQESEPRDGRKLERRPAYWTHDDEAVELCGEHLYYFAPDGRAKHPYTRQRHVEAIIDIADDGTLAGVELIYDMPPPPVSTRSEGGDVGKKPPRNPDVPCPHCGTKYLYTDYYDVCYGCGRNVGNETSARSAAAELDSEGAS